MRELALVLAVGIDDIDLVVPAAIGGEEDLPSVQEDTGRVVVDGLSSRARLAGGELPRMPRE
jgi:hypothetical protein